MGGVLFFEAFLTGRGWMSEKTIRLWWCGIILEQAMGMVQDAIGCWLDDVDEKDYPKASGVNDVDTSEYRNSFVTLVEFDKHVYEERCRLIAIARVQVKAEAIA